MNARNPIQEKREPAVLSLSFSPSCRRFVAGLSDGIRVFRSENCLRTLKESPGSGGGISVASVLDDRYVAIVGGGRSPASSPNVVQFWDCLSGQMVTEHDFSEPVLGLRLTQQYMAVVLKDKTILFEHTEITPPSPPITPTQEDSPERTNSLRGPNQVAALYNTSANTYALALLRKDLLVMPAASVGQVRVIPLPNGPKRVLRAHNTALRAITLSDDGTLLATASEQGTLVRVYSTKDLSQVGEFRRGADHAIIFSLSVSPNNQFLACTSDKGTLHIFDLRPPPAAEAAKPQASQHRRTQIVADRPKHRLSADLESTSGVSGRSSPQSVGYQASAAEYYGLRPPPISASPTDGPGVSFMAAMKQSPYAPRWVKDFRSIASAPFHMGDDPPNWQGQSRFTFTTGPDGRRKKVKNLVPPLPNDASGRPPKGVAAWKNDETLWVVAGGSDARWEQFSLLPTDIAGVVLRCDGYRTYLTRQFVDE